MNVIVVDISGKVDNYCTYLCESLAKEIGDEGNVTFFNTRKIEGLQCGFKKLVNLVPRKYWFSSKKWKRYLKAIEGVINYFYLSIYLFFHHVDIVHLQWFPFLEHNAIEFFFIKLIKGRTGQRRIVYTHHNLYPHGTKESGKDVYRKRFDKLKKYIDAFIVHTNNDRNNLHEDFNIPLDMIYVACHGVFEPREAKYEPVKRNDGKLQFLMFGVQSGYKGTDLFIEAIKLIPDNLRKGMSFRIIGMTSESLYGKYKALASELKIEWIPTAVSYEVLHASINEADVVVFPYRAISQSGALLLAIFFEKMIIPSDLPSFKETLEGFKDEWFFKSEDVEALSRQMICHLNMDFFNGEMEIIKGFKNKYSWQSAAQSTMNVYNQVIAK